MIKIEHPVFPSPEQMDFIIEGMRNAKNSWKLSDSYMNYMVEYDDETGAEIHIPYYRVGAADMKLMKTLAKAGTDHRKYLREAPVFLRITAGHTFWAQFDTYKVGTVRNSCSKMHKIHVMGFDKDQFDHEGIDMVGGYVLETFNLVRETLSKLADKFNKTQQKRYWRAMIELLPMGYHITANVSLNYEALLNMYFSRRYHKMDEWRIFCQWMLDNVPYFKELVDYIEKGDNKVSKGIKFSYVGKDEKVKSLKEFFSAEGFKVPDEELAAMTVELPKRATKGSAGYDCYSPIGFCLEPGQEIKLPTLLKAYMPQDIFLGAYPRSGLGFKYYARLANTVGIVDSDYADNEGNEGHIFVKIRNEGDKPMSINPGDGICQFIFQKYFTTEDDEAEGTREGGFGSTDK